MAIRIDQPLFILKRSFRSTLLVCLIVGLTFVTVAGHFVFARLEADQAKQIGAVLGTLLRSESSMSQFYLIAQSLEDMQTTQAIRCARLTKNDGGHNAVFYDSTFKKDCSAGDLATIEMSGLDGYVWILEVVPNLSSSFYVIKWSIFAISASFLFLLYRVLLRIFARDQQRLKTAERRRVFIEQLAEEARHDVASPISALRMIAEMAPLDPDTKLFLNAAVNRTSGIFQTLRDVGFKPESVAVSSEIRQIIKEKEATRADFPATVFKGDEVKMLLNKNEFCRMTSNILDNAHEAGAAKIEIRTLVLANSVQVIFSDDGKSIPQEVLEKMGERGNTLGKRNGSGLGLFQSYRFMRSLGGSFTAAARGEKFILEFPREIEA